MYPLYRCMDKHQMPHYPQPHFPRFDAIPPQHVSNEPWPYGCSYGYHPMPMGCHGYCCGPSYYTGYNDFRPPVNHHQSHFQPCHGTYHPVYYAPPPHCCGCPHHTRHGKEDTGVRIQEPSGNSLVPEGIGDYPSPIQLVPSEYMRNRGEEEPIELDLKKLKEANPDIGKGTKNQQKDDKDRFPFPLFWTPCKTNELESKNHKEKELPSSGIQIAPFTSPEGDDPIIQPKAIKEKSVKTIPVQQLDQQECTTAKQNNNGDEERRVKRQTSSPTKASKLPPVCLRVDPLPRRRNGGGSSSRSPSPPGLKKSKERDSASHKAIEVVEGGENVVGKMEEVKVKRKDVSEVEAVVIIQSRYRGFEVRKWEPLKKLKQIAQVQEELLGVRSHIQDLQSSGNDIDNRQRIMVGETIMSLLLKLDSIQGLHKSIRDIRKSVAKELVSLQETLDSMVVAKSSESLSSSALKEDEKKGEPVMKPIVEEKNEVLYEGGKIMVPGTQEEVHEEDTAVEQSVDAIATAVGSSVVDNSISLENEEVERNLLFELPLGVLDEEVVAHELQRGGQIEQGTDNVVLSDVVQVDDGKVATRDGQIEQGTDNVALLAVVQVGDDKVAIEDDQVEKGADTVVLLSDAVQVDDGEVATGDGQVEQGTNIVAGDGQVEQGTNIVALSDAFQIENAEVAIGDGQIEKSTDTVVLSDAFQMENAKVETVVEGQILDAVMKVPFPADKEDKVGVVNEFVHVSEMNDTNKVESKESFQQEPTVEMAVWKRKEQGEVEEELHESKSMDFSQIALLSAEEEQSPAMSPSGNKDLDRSGFGSKSDMKLVEENERLRKMMEKLIETGKEQLTTISDLTGRVKDLEKRLAQPQKKKQQKRRRIRPLNDALKRSMGKAI